MAIETSVAGAPAPELSAIDIALKGQAQAQDELNAKRVEQIRAQIVHKSIGGEDDTAQSIMSILAQFEQGLPYPFLQSVFPDAALVAARDRLKAEGKIEQIGKKGKTVLRLIKSN